MCVVCMNAKAFQRLLGLKVLEKKVGKKRVVDKQNKNGTYLQLNIGKQRSDQVHQEGSGRSGTK